MSALQANGRRKLNLIDVTVRDAPQSLWATRMPNWAILGYAEQMDRLGFARIDLVGGAVFDVCVRFLREDPWERMRLVRQKVQRTPLNMWTRAQSLFTFQLYPDEVVALSVRRAKANGIRHVTIMDCINDVRNQALSIEVAREEGLTVTGATVYSISPVHTDEYYAEHARHLVALGVDAVCLKDPSGLLRPERVRTLVPALRQALPPEVSLEVHSHCNGALAPQCYLEAMQLGADTLHTAISPLAHGSSLPPTEYVVHHAERWGYGTGVERAGLKPMADYFAWVAEREGQPLGQVLEHDPTLYEHHVPGGMISNLISQLRELRIEHRLEEVLEETARVRVELGYPVMVSPMSQYVVTQAVFNVLLGERYRSVPLEVRSYALGYYGRPPGPFDPNVFDRVTGGAEPFAGRPGERVPPVLDKLRAECGPFESDDDLLLAAFYAPDQTAALWAARARAAGCYESEGGTTPLAHLLWEIAQRPALRHVEVRQPALRLHVSR
ncbi:MAG: pyruvate carboxylase subunit B [Chloroflexi bacterium]|nr:pyruvate carboxylase subunit B [Chloroflexota bacterium]